MLIWDDGVLSSEEAHKLPWECLNYMKKYSCEVLALKPLIDSDTCGIIFGTILPLNQVFFYLLIFLDQEPNPMISSFVTYNASCIELLTMSRSL